MEISVIKIKKGKPVRFSIDVNKETYWLVRRKLEKEKEKIINMLDILKEDGKIKSIFRPKNRQIQPYLNELVIAKIQITESIKKLKILFN